MASSRSKLRLQVPAKVNPQIRVGPLQEDGYHDITLAYQAISLYDVLTVSSDPHGPSIEVSGMDCDRVPATDQNLVIKAAALLAKYVSIEPTVHFELVKAIPAEAGLGGGSADAAAALVGCNMLWKSNVSDEDLMHLGAYIGEDVPFFIKGMMAIGLGHKQPLRSLGTGDHTWIWVLGVPFRGLSTKAVFQEYDNCLAERKSGQEDYLSKRQGCLEVPWGNAPGSLRGALVNDLEQPSARLLPDITTALDAGRSVGAFASLMSGSGSTCAFLARDEDHARHMQAEFQRMQLFREVCIAFGPVPGVTIMKD
ncbi:Ribosomal protein S5 domain 2-type fold subgroup [Penicillium chermesinum]|uniref:4-(cytidine 5'-diphospho)-2-C-methyl-D-erythritol kinase n=1 Tax=Penicillium chermesinum TaxID=63820 RepID=A0A9W9TN11_9EURO|nr:Ribosomal protein S5 domain 2-type fold subgroup [Penicillium chermesinum]KAJ5232525.1 Ribosomal protein S5 domain 2-type fold subgroup [Penicillium chermesinum]KAJ6172180.1 Ribosomal protein S5 domain 2-type fold subgroup [Penicillium chermesinum]